MHHAAERPLAEQTDHVVCEREHRVEWSGEEESRAEGKREEERRHISTCIVQRRATHTICLHFASDQRKKFADRMRRLGSARLNDRDEITSLRALLRVLSSLRISAYLLCINVLRLMRAKLL